MKTTPHIPKTPKILPWLASKAGITERRAETLWHAAECHASKLTKEYDTPTYWQVAMDRLLELIAAESLREDAASFGWRRWARENKRGWQAPLTVLDALSLNMVRSWRLLQPFHLG
jgi:hypothetical protein